MNGDARLAVGWARSSSRYQLGRPCLEELRLPFDGRIWKETGKRQPHASGDVSSRAKRSAASSEWPPSSKKLSRMLTRSRPSTSAQTRSMPCSSGVWGAKPEARRGTRMVRACVDSVPVSGGAYAPDWTLQGREGFSCFQSAPAARGWGEVCVDRDSSARAPGYSGRRRKDVVRLHPTISWAPGDRESAGVFRDT